MSGERVVVGEGAAIAKALGQGLTCLVPARNRYWCWKNSQEASVATAVPVGRNGQVM